MFQYASAASGVVTVVLFTSPRAFLESGRAGVWRLECTSNAKTAEPGGHWPNTPRTKFATLEECRNRRCFVTWQNSTMRSLAQTV